MFAFRLPPWWPLNLTSPVIPQTPLWVHPLDRLKCLILYRVWRPCLSILSWAIQTVGFMSSSRKERRMVNITSLSQYILMYWYYSYCEVSVSWYFTAMYQMTVQYNIDIYLMSNCSVCIFTYTCMFYFFQNLFMKSTTSNMITLRR